MTGAARHITNTLLTVLSMNIPIVVVAAADTLASMQTSAATVPHEDLSRDSSGRHFLSLDSEWLYFFHYPYPAARF